MLTSLQAIFRDQVEDGFSSVEDGLAAESQSDYIVKTRESHSEEILKYPVDCYPLYSVLLALNRTSVDFFSLDVEGVEMGVLVYLPWHLLDIKVRRDADVMCSKTSSSSSSIYTFTDEHVYQR